MPRLSASILLVLGVQLAWTPPSAEAHVPPPAYITIEITDEHAEVLAAVQFSVFQAWFERAPGEVTGAADADPDHRAAVEAALRTWLHVRVDGAPVQGTLLAPETERFEDHLQTWEYVQLRVRYPTPVPSQRVAFAWTHYAPTTAYTFDEIDAELDAYGESSYPRFRKREPEFTWHRPRNAVGRAPVALPPPSRRPHVTVPLVSVAVVLLLLIGAFVLRRPTWPRRAGLALALGLLVAVPLMGFARVDVPLPWGTRLERPPVAEALAIFDALHQSVYAALDGRSEEEVYDRLAACVTGALLPELYLDIRASLVLEEEGGAVAEVQSIEISESAILPTEDEAAPRFEVRARWRVVGRVGHWGHTHQRVNEYLAQVTIMAVDGRWKLAAIEVLDEQRVDDG